jgi:DNA-binding NarL/FixJ family response regulator
MEKLHVRTTTYIIERLGFVAPYLAQTLSEADLDVLRVTDDIDFSYLQRASPDVIFADIDFLAGDAPATIRKIRRQSPLSLICVYTSQTDPSWAKTCHLAGANAVFTKLSTDEELIAGLRDTLAVGAYTDRRFLPGNE